MGDATDVQRGELGEVTDTPTPPPPRVVLVGDVGDAADVQRGELGEVTTTLSSSPTSRASTPADVQQLGEVTATANR